MPRRCKYGPSIDECPYGAKCHFEHNMCSHGDDCWNINRERKPCTKWHPCQIDTCNALQQDVNTVPTPQSVTLVQNTEAITHVPPTSQDEDMEELRKVLARLRSELPMSTGPISHHAPTFDDVAAAARPVQGFAAAATSVASGSILPVEDYAWLTNNKDLDLAIPPFMNDDDEEDEDDEDEAEEDAASENSVEASLVDILYRELEEKQQIIEELLLELEKAKAFMIANSLDEEYNAQCNGT